MNVMKLSTGQAADVKRLMLKEHPAGAAVLLDLMFDDYFLGESIGCAIGAYDERALRSVMFTSYEYDTNMAITRGVYGELGEHTKRMFEVLEKQLREKALTGVAFVTLAPKAAVLKEQLLSSSLGKRLSELKETSLPFGRIPTDKSLWLDVMAKNIPYEDMVCIRASYKR